MEKSAGLIRGADGRARYPNKRRRRGSADRQPDRHGPGSVSVSARRLSPTTAAGTRPSISDMKRQAPAKPRPERHGTRPYWKSVRCSEDSARTTGLATGGVEQLERLAGCDREARRIRLIRRLPTRFGFRLEGLDQHQRRVEVGPPPVSRRLGRRRQPELRPAASSPACSAPSSCRVSPVSTPRTVPQVRARGHMGPRGAPEPGTSPRTRTVHHAGAGWTAL